MLTFSEEIVVDMGIGVAFVALSGLFFYLGWIIPGSFFIFLAAILCIVIVIRIRDHRLEVRKSRRVVTDTSPGLKLLR